MAIDRERDDDDLDVEPPSPEDVEEIDAEDRRGSDRCPHCNAPVGEDAVTCPKCGQDVVEGPKVNRIGAYIILALLAGLIVLGLVLAFR